MNLNAVAAFTSILGKRFSQRWIDRLALAHDASLYRLVPEAIVRPISVHDIVSVLKIAHEHGLHLSFRAAGTSLSGQAVTDGILIDISRGWDSLEVIDNGQKVKCGPGITGGAVNAKLRPYGRKIGPDPASLQAAMIGGIVANNASGMCCGVRDNSYNTIDSIRFVLSSGREYNTALDADRHRFQHEESELYNVLKDIRTEILSSPVLIKKISTKYSIKNTMGYTLISFLDYEEPFDIFAHLLVGSEGTLGFIREATFNTVADATTKYTQLFTYPTLEEACATVQGWTDAGAAAVEIMDDASIASYASLERTPEKYKNHTPGSAALLVEFHDQEPPTHDGWVTSERERAQLWALRKGLMPTVGAARASGTTMINEDIAVPPERLAALVKDVKGAFRDHGYHDAIIFGHAKDGNIHFVISQDFSQEGELDRYDRFMQEIARIVVDVHNGSLKAEHGTGRNMSPFLEQEWGKEATEIMWRIKKAADPHNVLNPEVLLSDNTSAHIQNIKPVPVVDETVDTCIECGFCEQACPTSQLTLTPRQRIVIEREMSLTQDIRVLKELQEDRQYESIDTCAVDGVCSWSCPVGINTGEFVKQQRERAVSDGLLSAGRMAKNNWSSVETLVRGSHSLAKIVANDKVSHLGGGSFVPPQRPANPDVIYVPGCPSRWFGTIGGSSYVMDLLTLAKRAGINVYVADSRDLCCGQPLDSNGLRESARSKAQESLFSIERLVPEKSVPLVSDVSTCGNAWQEHCESGGRPMLTPVAFLRDILLPNLDVKKTLERCVVHPGCGTITSGDQQTLVDVLSVVAKQVSTPQNASCCGMAGAHGLRYPEVVTAALSKERKEVQSIDADAFVTLNPLCQSALHKETDVLWDSVWAIVERCTR